MGAEEAMHPMHPLPVPQDNAILFDAYPNVLPRLTPLAAHTMLVLHPGTEAAKSASPFALSGSTQ